MTSNCTCHDGLTCIPCYQEMLRTHPHGVFPTLWQTPPPPSATTSSQLQARIQEVARRLGGWDRFTVRRSDKAMVAAGFPDDLYLGHGRLVLIEFKNEGERVTIPQQHWLELFWHHTPHTECYIAWPSDEAPLVALLKGPTPLPRDEQWKTRLPQPYHTQETPHG